MVAVPWYLAALGIMLVIVGCIAGSLPRNSAQIGIDPRMSDAEIARRLRRRSSLGFPGFMIYAGSLSLAIGLVWRLIKRFL